MGYTLQRTSGPRGSGVDLSESDEVLVARAAVDPAAFAPLYQRYVEPIFRYCHRRLGSKEAAEDMTSAIFTKALAALPGFKPAGATFRGWLFAIAHNAIADEHRKRRVPDEAFGDQVEARDSAPTPEAAVLDAEAGQAVRAMLARLSPDQASVVELRLAGLSGQEVARALGRNPNTVKVTQYRAYARLRALFGEKEPNDATR